MTTKLTYTKEDSMLTQAELAEIRHYTLDDLEEQDEHYFDHFKPGLFCHYEASHKLAVDSVFGVANTNHVDVWVYSLIVGFTSGPHGACYLSSQEIADLFGYGDSAVRRSIKKLLGAKLIKQLAYRTGSPIKTLAAPLNHPALLDAKAWDRGELRSRSRAIVEDDPRRMQALQLAEVLREMALSADDSQLSVMFAEGGAINFDRLLHLLAEGKTLADKMNEAAANRAAEAEARKASTETTERPSEPDLLPTPTRLLQQPTERPEACVADGTADEWPYKNDYNVLADLAAEHTTRSIDNPATKAAYEALRADFSASELLDAYRCLEHSKKGTPDDKWPSLHSFLAGERSCRGRFSARRLAQEVRERSLREAAAAEAAEADRAAREREARQSTEYDRVLTRLAAEDSEYQQMHTELMYLLLNVKPGDAGSEVRQRLDELTPLHDARFESLKAEARRRCGLE